MAAFAATKVAVGLGGWGALLERWHALFHVPPLPTETAVAV